MGIKRLYVTCPVCGKMMCKASPAAQIEARCPVCKSELLAEIAAGHKVTVEVLKEGSAMVGA